MGQVVSVSIKDNRAEIKEEAEDKIYQWLQAIGEDASDVASNKCPVDTGTLKNSISWATSRASGGESDVLASPEPKSVYIGTNVEYAPYHEFGSGKYASLGSGAKKIPWGFEGKDGKWKGWHWTSGVKARHFIRFGMTAHKSAYKAMLEQYLKG